MQEEKYLFLIRQSLTGAISAAQSKQLDEWLNIDTKHRLLFQQYQKTWELSGSYSIETPDFEASVESDLVLLKRRLVKNKQQVKIKSLRTRIYTVAKIAAIGLLVIGVFLYQFNSTKLSIIAQTGLGEVKEIKLPDGSKVFLNENTSLSLDKNHFGKKDRKVVLQGEAYFEVKSDSSKTFIVSAEGTETSVLGTAFNIKAIDIDSIVQISVTKGKVSFGNVSTQTEILTKNKAAVYNKNINQLSLKNKFSPNIIAWKTKELLFNETPLPDVISQLEKYFKIEIKYKPDSLIKCKLHSHFKGESIDEILEILEFTFQLEFQKTGKNLYLLTGGSCQ